MCIEEISEFNSQCKGLCMFKDDKYVVIDKDSCYNDSYKLLYRNRRKFSDLTFLDYDEVLVCADKKILIEMSDKIQEKFVKPKLTRYQAMKEIKIKIMESRDLFSDAEDAYHAYLDMAEKAIDLILEGNYYKL